MFSLFFILYMRFLTEWNHVIKRPFSRFSRKYLASESRVIKFTWMLCRVQLDIHEINKMQKQKKFRASEYRAKFTWTMLSAAEILYQKKRPIIAHIILLIFRKPHLKMPGKNYKKFAWVDWKNYYLHRRKLQKSFLYSWLKQLSCNFFLVPLGAFHVGFLKLKQ